MSDISGSLPESIQTISQELREIEEYFSSELKFRPADQGLTYEISQQKLKAILSALLLALKEIEILKEETNL